VLLPSSAPTSAESLRLVLGWAWTYVIVAELIGASSGIGHMITTARRFLDTGQIHLRHRRDRGDRPESPITSSKR